MCCTRGCTLSRQSISIMLLLILPVLQHRYTSPELIRNVNMTNNKTLIFTPSTQGKICTTTLHGISNIFVHFASRGAHLGACVCNPAVSVWAWFRNPPLLFRPLHSTIVLIIYSKSLTSHLISVTTRLANSTFVLELKLNRTVDSIKDNTRESGDIATDSINYTYLWSFRIRGAYSVAAYT